MDTTDIRWNGTNIQTILCLTLISYFCHHLQELVELDCAIPICVHFINHVLQAAAQVCRHRDIDASFNHAVRTAIAHVAPPWCTFVQALPWQAPALPDRFRHHHHCQNSRRLSAPRKHTADVISSRTKAPIYYIDLQQQKILTRKRAAKASSSAIVLNAQLRFSVLWCVPLLHPMIANNALQCPVHERVVCLFVCSSLLELGQPRGRLHSIGQLRRFCVRRWCHYGNTSRFADLQPYRKITA